MGKTLEGKVCLVTGAARGIGRSIALRFAEEGALVYANTRNEENFILLQNSCEYPERLISAVFDMTDYASLKDIVVRIKRENGRIDVLVNNAAVVHNENIGMISPENAREMMQVNVLSPMELLQLTARVMKKQRSGSIINITSATGITGDRGQTAYSASKAAVIAMTKSAASELGSSNIRVNAVAPGLTDTDMFRASDEERLQARLERIPFRRIAEPSEIAETCVFFASDSSGYITGQVLGVCGGPM